MSYSRTAGRGSWSSLDVSIGAAARHAAARAGDRLTAETRFDPHREPAEAAYAARATSRPGRAAASRGWPTSESVTPSERRTVA